MHVQPRVRAALQDKAHTLELAGNLLGFAGGR